MSRLPSTGPSLQRYLRQQARAAQRQQQSSAFNLSGTSVVAADVTEVDGTLNVVGDLDVSGTANFDGNTTIGGNAAITGTLSLPSGIINNDALANPIQVQSIYLDARNFTLGTSWVTLAAQAIAVPAGFTKALVVVTGQVGCYNPHTTGGSDGVGGDFLLCQPYVGAVTGNALGAQFPGSNWWGNAVTSLSTVLTGLSGGGTFDVGIQAHIDYTAMPAYAANEATLSGNILWFR